MASTSETTPPPATKANNEAANAGFGGTATNTVTLASRSEAASARNEIHVKKGNRGADCV